MSDPRAENCKAFALNAANKVVGVELAVDVYPERKYRLRRVELVDEAAAMGNTVATCIVYDKDGYQVASPVRLAWPYPNLTDSALAGNPNGQHMITNGYAPPNLGPLALYVANDAGEPLSDIVGGLGLPYNRHVSYVAQWQERDASAPDPDPDPEPGGGGDIDDELIAAFLLRLDLINENLMRSAVALERLTAHLGG